MSAIHGIDCQSFLQRPNATLLCVLRYDNCARRNTLEQQCMIIATQRYGILFQFTIYIYIYTHTLTICM